MKCFANGHDSSGKVMAIAIALLMAACSFSVFMEGSDAVDNDRDYGINMMAGDSFSYTPHTSMDASAKGTVVFNSTCKLKAQGSLTFADNATFGFSQANAPVGSAFTGTPAVAGEYRCEITATWEYKGATQTARQSISFTVYEKIRFDSSSAGNVTKDIAVANSAAVDTVLFTSSIAAPSAAAFDTAAFRIDNASFTSASPFKASVSNGTLTVKVNRSLESFEDHEYVLTFPAHFEAGTGNDTVSDDATLTLRVNLGNTAIVSPSEIVSYVGEGNGTRTVQPQFVDTLQMTDVTWSLVSTTAPEGMVSVDQSSGLITIDTDILGNDDFQGTCNDYTIDITRSGTWTRDVGGESESVLGIAQKRISLEFFKSLEFTSKPGFNSNVNVVASSSSNQSIILEMTISGANWIKYNWGDDKGFSKNVTNTGSAFYSATHEYEASGTYKITVTAGNDSGTTTMYVLYDAESGEGTPAEEEPTAPVQEQAKSFLEQHGYMFIIFAVVAGIALLFVALSGGDNPLGIILFAVCAILSILFFCTGDTGFINAIIEAFNNLKFDIAGRI